MSALPTDAVITTEVVAGSSAAADAVSVMHRAFGEYAARGLSSGAMVETAESLQAEMASGSQLAVVRFDDRIVAMSKHTRAADGTLYFSRLSVDPHVRGQGLAGRLVRAMREYACDQGLSGLSCAVRADVPENADLYLHLGMEVAGTAVRVSRTGANIPVVLMQDPSTVRGVAGGRSSRTDH